MAIVPFCHSHNSIVICQQNHDTSDYDRRRKKNSHRPVMGNDPEVEIRMEDDRVLLVKRQQYIMTTTILYKGEGWRVDGFKFQ